MTPSDPHLTTITVADLPTRYPREVGRNARLGSHGTGGTSRIVIMDTDTRHRGWGLVEGPIPADPEAELTGRPLSELIDPATGIRDPRHHWLDPALHDLLGQVEDVPVYEVLGAHGRQEIEMYDGAIYFDDLDPASDPRGVTAVLDNCARDHDLGYRSFKLKIGRGHRWLSRGSGNQRDVEITRAVRAAYPHSKILVDANDGYELEDFCRYLDAVADLDLYWVEEPFLDDADDLLALRQQLDRVCPATRIAEGETDPDVPALLEIAANGGIDVLLMDVISFGLSGWRRLMPRLIEMGVAASPHAWGRPLKSLYAAHLAAGLGNIQLIEGVPGTTSGVDTDGYRFVDGLLTVSDRPGFGLRVPTL